MKHRLDDQDTSAVSALIAEKVHNAQYRLILELRFNDGLTYQEIADRPEIKINSVRQVGKIIQRYAPILRGLTDC